MMLNGNGGNINGTANPPQSPAANTVGPNFNHNPPTTPRAQPHQQQKKSFRTVFGIGPLDFRPRSPNVQSDDEDDDLSRSVLITTTGTASHSHRKPVPHHQSSLDEFRIGAPAPPTPKSATSSLDVEEMKIDIDLAAASEPPPPPLKPSNSISSRRGFKFGANDNGPWSVSVAEAPTEPKLYNVYVKTPTHNLTLTRSPRELIELHSKLRDAYPTIALPPFPLANFTINGNSNGKRRSSFLHTLSRLANSNSSSGGNKLTKNGGSGTQHTRPATAHGGTTPSPGANGAYTISASSTYANPTPLMSPPADTSQTEIDPFNDVPVDELGVSPKDTNGHQTSTRLASYLTTISNEPKIRTSRIWKRFVRVRTDDLESVRAERAVKRVRSDLAKHTSPKSINTQSGSAGVPPVPPLPSAASSFGMGVGVGKGLPPIDKSLPSAPVESASGLAGIGSGLGLGVAGGELPAVSVGPSFGFGIDLDSFGLSIPPVTDKPQAQTRAHAKEETERTLTQYPSTITTSTAKPASDKRVSSVMAMPSAFSSDSALAESAYLASQLGSAPPTPTPAVPDLPPVAVNPENVRLPPSPAVGLGSEVVEGLPTPVHSPAQPAPSRLIVRSASADPDKASRLSREFKASSASPLDFESGAEGDAGVTDAETANSDNRRDSDEMRTGNLVMKKTKRPRTKRQPAKKVALDDFEMMRVLGKGCAGKVLLVKYKKTQDLYALKAITKRHVLAHQELQHTLTEQAVLKRMSKEGKDPFVVKLWWSFHDKDNLFLVMDFHPGGDLATQLARWGRLGRDRARFYAAEIVEGVEGLHAAGVIYRDLKPENILIGCDGHIVLTDFGLSKEFPRRSGAISTTSASASASGAGTPDGLFAGTDYIATPKEGGGSGGVPNWGNDAPWSAQKDMTSTFCGTAEYLAPEVIQGLPYSYEADWWSFGTMLYEMLSGITPFWANNHSDMYVRVLQDELTFPEDRAMDQDTKSLIRGLLQRNPALRMSEPRIKRHPYFSMIDWDHVYYKRYIPPYIPPIDPSNASDTQNFDETFLEMNPTLDNDEPVTDSERDRTDDDETHAKTDGEESVKEAAAAKSTKETPALDSTVDVFDGYSYKGRHSVIINGEEDDGYAGYDEEEPDDELIEAKKVTDALAALHADSSEAKPVTTEDTSETKTIDQKNEPEPGQSVADAISVSVSPSTSTAPQSALTASISTESESVVAARNHNQVKQGSEHSEGTATTQSSAIPSLTVATTAATTPSGEYAESPSTASDSPSRLLHTRIVSEGSLGYDDALRAPLPLSPVIEAVDLETGRPTDEEGTATIERAKTPLVNAKTPSPVQLASPLESKLPSTPIQNRVKIGRKEKAPIDPLDRLRRSNDDDVTEREEDDWDLVEAPGGEDRNGAKGTSLWQRGVVDRYRLSVFRKGNTPRASRTASGMGYDSMGDLSAVPTSPSETKHRRGRTTGLSLRKSTKEFLRAKSPSANMSAYSTTASRASLAQASNGGLLTPSPSGAATSPRPKHSLKSKSSALSKLSANSPGSSDQSVTDLHPQGVSPLRAPLSPRSDSTKSPSRASPADDLERQSNLKKMKKGMEHGAEKMLSLFGAPRQQHGAQ